jgi:proline iminopeptidase
MLGYSYGSVVVQEYALKCGMHVKHLIFADGLYSARMWQENCDNLIHEYSENDPELWNSLMAIRSKGFRSSDPVHANLYNSFRSGLLFAYNPENFKHLPEDANYPNDFNSKLYYQFVGNDGDFIIGNVVIKFDVTEKLKDLKMPVLFSQADTTVLHYLNILFYAKSITPRRSL